MVRAAQKGELENPSPEVSDVADDISVKDAKKFAKTKHKGLPEKKMQNEGTSFSKWRKNAKSAMQKAVNRKSEVLKKPEKAQDAGAKARRKLQRREYADKVSTIIPKELEDQKNWSGFKKLLD